MNLIQKLRVWLFLSLFSFGCLQHSFQRGTVSQIDAIIKDEYVLKAISFSISYKDSLYKDVLVTSISLTINREFTFY